MYLYHIDHSNDSIFEGGVYDASNPMAWPFLLRNNE
jgi:hypothetical protein